MKKLIAGCLIVLAIAAVGFSAAAYYAYRWAQPMIQKTGDYLERARELARLSDRVANRSPYVPPAGGELTPSQIERYLAVQARVHQALGARWTEIEKKSADIREKTKDGRQLTFTEFTTVVSDLAGLYTEARREQVDALNAHRFSDDEYRWVRLRVYEAAGMEISSGIDLARVEQIAKDNGMTLTLDADKATPQVPAANLELVRPHLAKLKESFPLAVLGL